VVDSIRKARPRVRLNLEMITRDPLKVPCLMDRYWLTFPERSGVYLARTLDSCTITHRQSRFLTFRDSKRRRAAGRKKAT